MRKHSREVHSQGIKMCLGYWWKAFEEHKILQSSTCAFFLAAWPYHFPHVSNSKPFLSEWSAFFLKYLQTIKGKKLLLSTADVKMCPVLRGIRRLVANSWKSFSMLLSHQIMHTDATHWMGTAFPPWKQERYNSSTVLYKHLPQCQEWETLDDEIGFRF